MQNLFLPHILKIQGSTKYTKYTSWVVHYCGISIDVRGALGPYSHSHQEGPLFIRDCSLLAAEFPKGEAGSYSPKKKRKKKKEKKIQAVSRTYRKVLVVGINRTLE